MAHTQMALDSLDFDATMALAETVAPHVDILEIGTPCIKPVSYTHLTLPTILLV